MDVRQELLRRFAAPLPEYYTRRIVVFRDDQGGFAADVEQMELPDVRILIMRENEWFTLRRQIESDYAQENILLYCPREFERWQDNWLADVFKYSEEFRADYWSLLFEELHIADGVKTRGYAQSVGRFFASRERVAKLGALKSDYRTEQELKIGVMSVLCGLKSASFPDVVGAVVLGTHEEENEKLKAIGKFCGEDAFWLLVEGAFGYTGQRDAGELACYLLTSAAWLNAPEDAFAGLPGAADYAQQAYALFTKWLHTDREALLETCHAVEERYPIAARLQRLERAELMRVSVYPSVDALLIRTTLTAFAQNSMNVDEVQEMMQARRELPWWGLYAPYADVLGALCDMQLFARAYREGFHFTDAEEMFAAYASRLYRMDAAYRHVCAAADQALTLGLFALEDELKAAMQAAERLYKNGYLAPLGVCWSALLAGQTLETALAIVPRQERFYAEHVRGEDARTFVIISDALRYDVAQELTERLHGRLSGNTVCTAMVGTIPTITPVGMAALLPHKKLTLTEELSVLCDGMRTDAGNREVVLRAACPQSTALELGVFRRMTRTQRQEIARESKVVYLYQDVIDRTGESDGDVFAACETAMGEIEQVMRMLVSELSAAYIYVTADHGFIYTRSPLDETDKAERELAAGDVLCYKRRYAIVRENVSDERTLSMPLTMLGRREWACVTPRGDLRFKQQGGASPYMHGGLSLQELAVPLIAYRNKKAGQKGYRAITKTNIVLLGENRTISNGIFTLVFYQQEACGGKVQPRTVNARFVDKRGQPISDSHRIIGDSTAIENNDRTTRVTFRLLGSSYDKNERYDLVLTDEEDKTELVRVPFTIDIVFGMDFDF